MRYRRDNSDRQMFLISFDRSRCLLHLLDGRGRKTESNGSSEIVGSQKSFIFLVDKPIVVWLVVECESQMLIYVKQILRIFCEVSRDINTLQFISWRCFVMHKFLFVIKSFTLCMRLLFISVNVN